MAATQGTTINSFLLDPPLPRLALLAFSNSLGPGLNNLLIAASGASFGTRRWLPTLAGMCAGFALMFVDGGLDAATVF